MADTDVRIKVSLDGDKLVIDGLEGIGDAASESDSKLGSMVSGGLAGAGKAIVGLGLAAVAGGAALSGAVVSAYADAQQSVGGIETLFGDSADKMKQYAANAYRDAGLGANAYMEQATGFAAALTGSLAEGADAADAANNIMVAMSDNANKMGTDMESIQNAYAGFSKQNFTMLDNLKLGYGGTAEEMKRLLDDAEKLPAAMGQKFDLNNFADVSTAIQLIQEDMGIAGTTALEAAETVSGSFGMLSGSFDNLLVALGAAGDESLAFLDIQTQVENVIMSLETVVSNVAPVIGSIGETLGDMGPQLGEMLGGLVGTVTDVIPDIIQAGVGMIEGLIGGITSALPGLIQAIVPGLVGIVSMIATQLPLLVDAGMQAIIALGQGIVQALPELIPAILDSILFMVEAFIQNLPMLLDVALQIVTALATGIVDYIPVLIEALPTLILSLVDFLLGAIPQLIEAGIELLLGIVGALPEIIEGIVAAIPLIIAGIQEAVLGSIPEIIQGGLDLFLALVGALPEIIVGIVAAIPQIISSVVSAISGNIPLLISTGVKLLTSLVTNLPSILSTILGSIGKIISGIFKAIVGAAPQMASAGLDLIKGLWNGISNATDWLLGKISGFVDSVMGGIKDFFGIKSPSLLMEDEVGEMLPPGIGRGVEKSKDKALAPVRSLSEEILEEVSSIPTMSLEMALNTSRQPSQSNVQGTPSAAYSPLSLASLADGRPTTANISSSDMELLAHKVALAILEIRNADGRQAALSVQQGAR